MRFMHQAHHHPRAPSGDADARSPDGSLPSRLLSGILTPDTRFGFHGQDPPRGGFLAFSFASSIGAVPPISTPAGIFCELIASGVLFHLHYSDRPASPASRVMQTGHVVTKRTWQIWLATLRASGQHHSRDHALMT